MEGACIFFFFFSCYMREVAKGVDRCPNHFFIVLVEEMRSW